MNNQKILYILRHAKAETGNPAQDDHDRVLSPRGVEAVAIMGKYCKEHAILPEKVLCSTATRTVETLMKLEEAIKRTLPVEYSRKLYLASAGEVLNMLAQVPETISKLMVIGHNPGLHQLALKLARTGDDAVLDALTLKLPTCALVAVEFADASWAELRNLRGKLLDFKSPKMLETS